MQKKKRSKYAQNRLDYIVYGNPGEARKILDRFGFEAPDGLPDLAHAIRQLVRRKGRRAIVPLLRIHPDARAILRVHQKEEDSFCGACGYSNYTGTFKNGTLMDMGDLEDTYKRTVTAANANPNDKNLAGKVQEIWHQLREKIKDRKEAETTETKAAPSQDNKGGFALAGVLVISGILMGYAATKAFGQ